jgi:hypothetical protein
MIDTVRRSEYTGENRCWACTWANTAITLLLLCVVVSVTWVAFSPAIATLSGIVVGGGSMLAIWLRGYLFPGTPVLTKRYLPAWLLAWFGKEPLEDGATTPVSSWSGPDSDRDLERHLVESDVLVRGPGGELGLSESFADAWRQQTAERQPIPDPVGVMAAVGLDPSDIEIGRSDGGATARQYGAVILTWPSDAAVVADHVSVALLADRLPNWELMNPIERCQLLRAVRLFLPECPDGGPTRLLEETVDSCCTSSVVAAVVCDKSGDRLIEQPVQR